MKTIHPVSDLRNYSSLLKKVVPGHPVILTENGREKYVIQDYRDYEQTQAAIELLNELAKGMDFHSIDDCSSLSTLKDKYAAG